MASSSSNPVQVLDPANSLSELVKDKGSWIFGESDSKRRLITIEKRDGSYGFTLQSYGVRYKHGNRETDFITYVNAVENGGAARQAGLREGDVILSINGHNMARVEHSSLVSFIRKCPSHLKMVVISDDRARKVELHMRYVHLQKKLQDKLEELEELNKAEKELLLRGGGYSEKPPSAASLVCLGEAPGCCFCPHKLFPEGKKLPLSSSRSIEKDIGGTGGDCYRKSQSTKELRSGAGEGAAAVGGLLGSGSILGIKSQISQSGGELSTLISPTPSTPLRNKSPAPSTSGEGRSGSGSGSSKPKSWDNLLTTKSFGGYGFGFGYGYYPTPRRGGGGGGRQHFSHPHHHNHHTHCSGSHPHSSYYFSHNKPIAPATSSRRSSEDPSSCSHHPPPHPFTSCTTYKIPGTTRVVARVSMGNDMETTRIRTLPSAAASVRSASTAARTSAERDYSKQSIKLEKTLSDSSLNEFSKRPASYYNRSSGEDGAYSSNDEYEEEYAMEANFGPKNDIYV